MFVWDNVRLHLTVGVRDFVAANAAWLTFFHLPAYAPDLNPQEGIGRWSNATSAASPQPTRRKSPGLRSADSSRSTTDPTRPDPSRPGRRLSERNWPDHGGRPTSPA
ncbi:transposase [Streptomyces sp. NPDC012935]|uniref:transposase n=1 Tax=Streptomyces sp. NPDC012935 TaxID=3364857 RepID=UPI0036858577